MTILISPNCCRGRREKVDRNREAQKGDLFLYCRSARPPDQRTVSSSRYLHRRHSVCTPGHSTDRSQLTFCGVGRILGTNNVKMSGFALRQAASVLLCLLVFFPSTKWPHAAATPATVCKHHEIVHDTADHIVQGMRQAIPLRMEGTA